MGVGIMALSGADAVPKVGRSESSDKGATARTPDPGACVAKRPLVTQNRPNAGDRLRTLGHGRRARHPSNPRRSAVRGRAGGPVVGRAPVSPLGPVLLLAATE